MTRTGLVPALMRHVDEPVLTLHPDDAARHGIVAGGLTRVTTDDGEMVLRAETRLSQRRGEIFAPMHWTDRFASAGPIGRILSGRRDPHSGQPALKSSRATIAAVTTHFHGVLLRRDAPALPDLCHWVRIPVEHGHLYRLTSPRVPPVGAALTRFVTALVGDAPDGEWLEATDPRLGVVRVAVLVDGVVDACLFLAHDRRHLPAEAAIAPLIGQPVPTSQRSRLLAGWKLDGQVVNAAGAGGPTICACFGVTRGAIHHAIVTHDLIDTNAIGSHLRAGTNCGSCIPELQEILRNARIPAQ